MKKEGAFRSGLEIDTPEQATSSIEASKETIQGDLDINPLRGNQPSELSDGSNALAVATERGQSIGSLI